MNKKISTRRLPVKLVEPRPTHTKRNLRRLAIVSESDGMLSLESKTLVASVPPGSITSGTVKRTVDLALAIAGGLILMPLLVVLAFAIKFTSRGPIFYRQIRIGRGGRPFHMWKFRTMVADAEQRLDDQLLDDPAFHEAWVAEYKLKDDPRVIPWIGRALRKSSLDEMPQLWNVLLGEMSLVGPRPLPRYHLDQFEEDFRCLRSAMSPGMTGQWQVCSRENGQAEMFRKWDTYYVRNWTIWLDFQILSRTPLVVFSGKGAV